ncbi:hypothetical protein LMG24238_04265 [Paraburkholderia sediminicola]|uniref:ADP-heptose:LPS heptosyltransferase n=1 Tax=Paraburkholderia sediminicola TaxID=458836 RepID=A0A6J5BNM0_9BURK|nr:glycosyltransferase family 9 protein [Paraburkholderia sediminicola]CAB3712318.1 hypothetical protein LMG24238_04265 [Paraburkholderia sediminicola]
MNSDLRAIKISRLRQMDLNRHHVPLLGRSVRRYRELSTTYSQPVVVGYFINRALAKGWSLTKSKLIKPMKLRFWKRPGQASIRDGSLAGETVYAIRITGGLGDAIIIARLARDLQVTLGGQTKFDVYFLSPKIIEPFFRGIPGFRESIHVDAFSTAAPHYTFSLIANQFVTFLNEHMHYRALLRDNPKVLSLFGHVQAIRKDIEKYIVAHPSLDGSFADIAVRQNHTRNTYLHEMLGIDYGGDLLNIGADPTACQDFGLMPKNYVTVHDGWDTKFKLVAHRPTKALPLQTWIDVVRRLKAARPDLMIVQLGGKTGDDIPGVDVNLKNKLTFAQSASILAGSALHLDTESGLVHIAATLGVKSVVMFGPTNVKWFGYSQNANISPRQCGNCWWSTDSWMDFCAAGYERPACMGSIDAQHVVSNALLLLSAEPVMKTHEPAPEADACVDSVVTQEQAHAG